MKVYKFGGASVRGAEAVRNLTTILQEEIELPHVIVISAMGKMTNALERLISNSYDRKGLHEESFQPIVDFHERVATDLLGVVPQSVGGLISDLREAAKDIDDLPEAYYSKIVAFGELLSTTIIHAWLERQIPVIWLDARQLILTDDDFKAANIQWTETEARLQTATSDPNAVYITQGFIGGTLDGKTTTLGREGSDFSAAAVAFCLGASGVTVWKDVPGIMNADPKIFDDAQMIETLSYDEVTEMAYFGAKVIHPKTLEPLARAGIPLQVKSFIVPKSRGSLITNQRMPTDIPCFVFRQNQVLVTLRSQESTILSENLMTDLLQVLRQLRIETNLFQHSALSFSFCFDEMPGRLESLMEKCVDRYDLFYNLGLQLATVKNATDAALDKLPPVETKYLEQSSRNTYQVLFKPLTDAS